MHDDQPLMTRREARELGLRHFFTGRPCSYGHVAPRFVSDGKCKECGRAKAAARYHRDLDAARAKANAYYAASPEKTKKASMKRYYANRGEIRAQRRERYRSDPAAAVESVRKWRANNPIAYKAQCAKRRALKRGASGTHTASDLVEIKRMQRNRCAMPWCRKKLNGDVHLDHIIPLSRGGSNERKNLQFLCATCNLRKREKDMLDVTRERGLLL